MILIHKHTMICWSNLIKILPLAEVKGNDVNHDLILRSQHRSVALSFA